MDRERREEANHKFRDALVARLEANRGGIRIEGLMGRRREEPEPETTEDEADEG